MEAMGALLARHLPVALAVCRRLGADGYHAEEATQEAAIVAMLQIQQLRRPDRFGAWLTGIAINVWRRLLRERFRDDWSWEAIQGGRVEVHAAWYSNPEWAVVAADVSGRVRDAVSTLPGGQRDAVFLYYLEGLTTAETADELNVGKGAVKTRLFKARSTLRHRLREEQKEDKMSALGNNGSVQVRVDGVRRARSEGDGRQYYLVTLQEVDGERRLPIWVGPFEGTAIALQIEKAKAPRPLTFAFMADVLKASGTSLREVRIRELVEGTFFAVAVVEAEDGRQEIDCRPSDGISLALATGVPILAESGVFTASDKHLATHVHEPLQEAKYHDEGSVGEAEIAAEVTLRWPDLEC